MNTTTAAQPLAAAQTEKIAPTGRIMAIDALRGFDMFWILGANEIVYALKRMSAGPFTTALAGQLEHKDWQGFAFYDLIFPLFVFIVGVSLVFSLTKSIERDGLGRTHVKIVRRFVLLYILALIYSGGVSNEWPEIRLLGVLNRIAICYLFAAIIFCHFRWKGIAGITAGLLIGYWGLMTFVPFPDVRQVDAEGRLLSSQLTVTNVAQLNFNSPRTVHGVFEPGVNLSNYIDQKYLPGKKWDRTWDPEGLLSTIPAIAICLLGVLAGLLLQNKSSSDQRKVQALLVAGAILVGLGFLWGLQFPVIKKIWTSSYVLVAGGYSALLLGVFYLVIEVWQVQRWTKIFVWIGANAITLYLAKNMIDFRKLAARFAGGDVKNFFDSHVATGFGDLVVAAVVLALIIFLARFLYQRRIFLRV
jgi:predicted acyltransferase